MTRPPHPAAAVLGGRGLLAVVVLVAVAGWVYAARSGDWYGVAVAVVASLAAAGLVLLQKVLPGGR